jgi:hypothetical protein
VIGDSCKLARNTCSPPKANRLRRKTPLSAAWPSISRGKKRPKGALLTAYTCLKTPVQYVPYCSKKKPVGSGLNGTSTEQERRINHEQEIKRRRCQTKEEERTKAFESLPFHATADISKAPTEPSSDMNTCVLQLFLMLRLCKRVSCTAILAARFCEHDCVETSAELWDGGRSRHSTSGINVVYTSCHNCLGCGFAHAQTLDRVSVSQFAVAWCLQLRSAIWRSTNHETVKNSMHTVVNVKVRGDVQKDGTPISFYFFLGLSGSGQLDRQAKSFIRASSHARWPGHDITK